METPQSETNGHDFDADDDLQQAPAKAPVVQEPVVAQGSVKTEAKKKIPLLPFTKRSHMFNGRLIKDVIRRRKPVKDTITGQTIKGADLGMEVYSKIENMIIDRVWHGIDSNGERYISLGGQYESGRSARLSAYGPNWTPVRDLVRSIGVLNQYIVGSTSGDANKVPAQPLAHDIVVDASVRPMNSGFGGTNTNQNNTNQNGYVIHELVVIEKDGSRQIVVSLVDQATEREVEGEDLLNALAFGEGTDDGV